MTGSILPQLNQVYCHDAIRTKWHCTKNLPGSFLLPRSWQEEINGNYNSHVCTNFFSRILSCYKIVSLRYLEKVLENGLFCSSKCIHFLSCPCLSSVIFAIAIPSGSTVPLPTVEYCGTQQYHWVYWTCYQMGNQCLFKFASHSLVTAGLK